MAQPIRVHRITAKDDGKRYLYERFQSLLWWIALRNDCDPEYAREQFDQSDTAKLIHEGNGRYKVRIHRHAARMPPN